MLPLLGPLIWGFQRLGYKGRAELGMGFEQQTESGLGKRVGQQKVSERCRLSEGSGKTAARCREPEQLGTAELERLVGCCRRVVFACCMLAVGLERAAEQCMPTESDLAQ